MCLSDSVTLAERDVERLREFEQAYVRFTYLLLDPDVVLVSIGAVHKSRVRQAEGNEAAGGQI